MPGLMSNLAVRQAINGMPILLSGGRGGVNLNTAYVHGTSGTAIAIRFMAHTTDAITELYIFLDATTGTRGNVVLECKIYNENPGNGLRVGSTVRATKTAVAYPAADDQWIKFTFAGYTPVIGEILWFVIYNTAAAPATDFPTPMTATVALGSLISGRGSGFSHTIGFSTNATQQPEMPFVIKQGSNYFGNPYTQASSVFYANNTRKRGIVVTPATNVYIGGFETTGSSALTDLLIFDNVTGPGGTPLNTVHLDSDTNKSSADGAGYRVFDAPILLAAGVTYKFVISLSANFQLPQVLQIEDYASYPAVFDGLVDGHNVCASCIDDGAGGWTIDKSICPYFILNISSFATQRSFAA